MSRCEENNCENIQSAICLHCNRRLCTSHIVAHQTSLLEEADELCQEINQLAESLDHSLEQIHADRDQALNSIYVWKEKELEKLEQQCKEKIHVVDSREQKLLDLRNQLTQRLAKDAREPLQRMQIQKSTSVEIVQAIRLVLANIKWESKSLDWDRKDVPESNVSTTDADRSPWGPYPKEEANQEHNYAQFMTRFPTSLSSYIYPSPVYSSNYESFRSLQNNTTGYRSQFPTVPPAGYPPFVPYYSDSTHTTNGLYPDLSPLPAVPPRSDHFLPGEPPMFGAVGPFAPYVPATPWHERVFIDPDCLPKTSLEELKSYFKDLSGNSDNLIEQLITQRYGEPVNANGVMILILSLLEVWHPKDIPNEYNHHILTYRITTIKRFCHTFEHQLLILAAFIIFIESCHETDAISSAMMHTLLDCFFDNGCLTRGTLLQWFYNGETFGFHSIHQHRYWAQPFMLQLDPTLEHLNCAFH